MKDIEPVTVEGMVQRFPQLTVGGLRKQLLRRHRNGLGKSGAVLKVGRRVLLDPDKFWDWAVESARLEVDKRTRR